MPLINSSFTAKVRNPGRDNLLDYLARRFTYHTREEWAALLALGRLELEGKAADGGELLREGQALRFAVVDYLEPEVPTDFHVVGMSGDLCFVHKPAGMPVHRTGKIFFQTLANLVRAQLGDDTWSPLSRLDRETSGLVSFARGPAAFRELAPAASGSDWLKVYAAVVRGEPSGGEGRWEAALGEIEGDAIRCRMHAGMGGKSALTLYKTLAVREGLALVALSPITGRKHQLRVHLAAAGCPVVGDKIYSLEGRPYLRQLQGELTDEEYRELGAPRHLLHCFHLRIRRNGGDGKEAWDWQTGPEFDRHFGSQTLETWSRTADFSEFRKAAEAARREIAPTAETPGAQERPPGAQERPPGARKRPPGARERPAVP